METSRETFTRPLGSSEGQLGLLLRLLRRPWHNCKSPLLSSCLESKRILTRRPTVGTQSATLAGPSLNIPISSDVDRGVSPLTDRTPWLWPGQPILGCCLPSSHLTNGPSDPLCTRSIFYGQRQDTQASRTGQGIWKTHL
jgi:hypothetical protein